MEMDREFVLEMIDYVKYGGKGTMAEKCKTLGITIGRYYRVCELHGLDGKKGLQKKQIDLDKARWVMAHDRKRRSRLIGSQSTQTETPETPEPTELTDPTEPTQSTESTEPTEVINQHDSGIQKCTQAQDSLE